VPQAFTSTRSTLACVLNKPKDNQTATSKAKKYVSVLDLDGDGDITDEEVKIVIAKSRLDTNRDGVITRDEIDGASALAIMKETDLYKETSRQTRLDVFDYLKWEQHRSPSRFFTNLATIGESRVVRSIWRECAFSTGLALLLWIFNDVIRPYAARRGLFNANLIHLNMLPWTIASAFLSLLLVFRTNSSYQRWAEARAVWGSVTNTVRDINRQLSWRSAERQKAPRVVARLAAFIWALKAHVGGPLVQAKCAEKIAAALGEGPDLAIVQASTHKPMCCLGLITTSIDELEPSGLRAQKADQGVTILMDNLGKCERIFKTPIPRIYTKHTERFLGVWIATLPIGMYDVLKGWTMLPAMFILSVFLFGISELANQIEEPFSILPLEAMCEGIHASIKEDQSNSNTVVWDKH